MTVVEHLTELRYRLMVSIGAVVVGAIVAYAFYRPILDFLSHPINQASEVGDVKITGLFVSGVTGPFILRMKVSAFGGLILALPILLYQFWRFITPGLEPKERRYAIPFVLSSLILFGAGVWFAFLILPTGVRFLLSFVEPGLQEPLITFQEYLSFITLMIAAFGLTFEFPLVLVFLAMVGIVDSRRLRRWRRQAILLVFLTAAVATPSQDPLSMMMMAAPLYLLFETSILVIRFVLKK
ncbi:MAG TPA: twin-arginine translocase subunit TatC [Actinomycetota bacterium]|nr:twin-arginine translocase subunit TatC [Actinomycetota bacterium]